MREMTPRERVYTALNFKEPDRVPIAFVGGMGTDINVWACSQLYEYLCLKDTAPIEITEMFSLVANPDERLVRRLHSDMRAVGPNPPRESIEPDGTKTWTWLCGARIKRVGYYDEFFGFPMRHMTTKEDIDAYPWPDPKVNIMEGVVERARYLHEQTDYFVVGANWFEFFPFNGYAYLSGMDKWLTDIKVRPKFYHQLAEKFLELNLAIGDQFYGGIGQYLDGVNIADDLGTQEAALMSHNDYVQFVKPYTAEIIKNIRKYIRPEAKIIMHCCGSMYWAIPDLIDIGVNALNPVQPLARNMEPWRLKRDFGGKIAFQGGLDTQLLLPLGTTSEIRQGVKKLMQEYAPGGGYIFVPSLPIQPDVPPENVVTAFDAALEYGKYPIPEPSGQSYVDFIKGLNLQGRNLGCRLAT